MPLLCTWCGVWCVVQYSVVWCECGNDFMTFQSRRLPPTLTTLVTAPRRVQHGANVHACRFDGATPLIMASNRGKLTNLSLLLEARADVNAPMKDGTTALHTATYMGHASVVKALISAKAEVGARCYDGVNPLLMAAKAGREPLVSSQRRPE